MTALANHTKVITLQCRLNATRDTLQVVEQIAQALQIEAGEHDEHEWVRLVHLRTVNKENANAR